MKKNFILGAVIIIIITVGILIWAKINKNDSQSEFEQKSFEQKPVNSTESEYFAHIFNTIHESYPGIFSEMKREKFEWYIRKDPVSTPEVKEISGWGIETQNIFDSAELYDIFKYRLFFEQSLQNAFDGPQGSIFGYIKNVSPDPPSEEQDTACLVKTSNIPPMTIKIICGFLR